MAYKLVILEQAQQDYEGIIDYLISASDGPTAARKFADEFDRQTELVCDNPQLHGLSRMPALADHGYRVMLVHNYIALYFFRDEMVVIAHIFHQSQDYARYV